MSLKAKIQDDLTNSMKAQKAERVSVLRMLKAEIMKFEVSGNAKKEATDEDILTILQKQVKQRKDSAEQFRNGDREEMAVKEENEEKILQEYLPEQISEDELREIVKATIEEVGATSKADMGKVMGPVMSKTKGQADGKLVNKLVMELLS